MAGHSRPKDGVATLAYAAIHVLFNSKKEDVDARHKAGHDEHLSDPVGRPLKCESCADTVGPHGPKNDL
jgi:hypothetical protein